MYPSAILCHFSSDLFYFGTFLLHIQFYSLYEHNSASFLLAAFTSPLSPFLTSYICSTGLSSISCFPFHMHLNGFFLRPNYLFSRSWQQFLPNSWYLCARILAVTFESAAIFIVTKPRASNFGCQLSIERIVSVKQLNVLIQGKTYIVLFMCSRETLL